MSSKGQRTGSDYRRKRKRFHANQYTRKVSDTLAVDCISASAKKLCKENYLDKEVRNSNQSNGYRMINIDILLSELSKYLICPNCNTKAVLKEKILYGLVSEFYVECYSCSTLTTFKSSSVIASSKDYEVNTRITYAMRTVGLGFCGIKNFCTAMDLPPPVSQKSYERILRKINLASREVADDSMKNAAKEEVSASGSNEICVSGDGTWKTRGHTSRIGVCSVIGDVTGKVIDVAVLSSYCKGCEKWRGPKSGHSYEEWKLKHQPNCVKNHIGSSSKMEVDGMKEIFQRSMPQRNEKYIKYIGDGDTKTFPELQRTAPYSIEKVECVGHIQKRMGARLRKLKTMNRGKKLSDGKSISGKNRLTDKFIDTITTYYGNAIRQNNSSVSDMRQAIWAIYCHYRSTDEEPMHHFCPIGDTSWCKYQKAVATNSASLFKHKNIVPIATMDEIKPIIAELSAPKLLKKCVGVKHKTLMSRSTRLFGSTAPKLLCGSSENIVDIAVNEAIVMFNEGMTGHIKIMKALGFKIGHFTVTSAFKAN
ncbi:uncharacterized protein TNCV_4214711 [Trichonephila clavipes]|nr:uncharacterized protein TNCV_4214711 [Trichonephila clavipes]